MLVKVKNFKWWSGLSKQHTPVVEGQVGYNWFERNLKDQVFEVISTNPVNKKGIPVYLDLPVVEIKIDSSKETIYVELEDVEVL